MATENQKHFVVFDVNVYLDVARLLGPPFTWEKFSARSAAVAADPCPHPDPACDSLRAIAVCMSGRFAGSEQVEVWTNAHIDKIVQGKARESVTPDPETGFKGLGWSLADAQNLVADLVYGLIEISDGGTLGGDHYPDGNPPLDHEDGMVYGACRFLADQDPLGRVYCVTRDRGFLAAYKEGQLDEHSVVLPPAAFVALVRAARTRLSIQAMAPRDRRSGQGEVGR